MKLVLIRHGMRSSFELGDAPLTPAGHVQAHALTARVERGALPPPTSIQSSPKRRARETFTPLALTRGLNLTIDARLDERHQNESARDFEDRLRSWIDDHTLSDDACVYACSHLDWLEAALAYLPTDLTEREISLSWSNGQFRFFELSDGGLWLLRASGILPSREERTMP